MPWTSFEGIEVKQAGGDWNRNGQPELLNDRPAGLLNERTIPSKISTP
jgi:hypothetical protein